MTLMQRERERVTAARREHPIPVLVLAALLGALVGAVICRIIFGDWGSTTIIVFAATACSIAAIAKRRRR